MARQDKVQEALKRQISTIIHDELKDPRLGFVTVTKVEISKDLSFAKVFFSVLGKEQDYVRTKEALASGVGFIRKLIAERMRLRITPELSFREDKTSQYSLKIQQVLDEIKESDEHRKNG